jgi:aminoglycoside 6'-N-acetyltransferase
MQNMVQGAHISLRVVTQTDLTQLEAWANDPHFHGAYGTFGLHSVSSIGKRFAEEGFLSSQSGQLLIIAPDETVIGMVSYHTVRYGPNESSHAYNIGVSIVASQRGKGYGVEAQQLLAAYLFSTYPVMRVEALTDTENIPEQRALEKAGFTPEGVIRQAQWRQGQWHDLIMYSKLRSE